MTKNESFRALMLSMLNAYLLVVHKKHGITPVDPETLSDLSNEDLSEVLDYIRDLAHLPSR